MERGDNWMNGNVKQPTSSWRRHHATVDRLWVIGLTLAATILLTLNLGSVPLKDWDEGLVAQVAREIWQAPAGSLTWLHPTLWGEPYFNKPPLVHWFIAGLYAIAGVNEWTARLPSAGFTILSVPLFYGISRAVFHRRLPALFATVVYLTSLAVVRNGRFAMLDGAILCFQLLMIWCLLRARRDYRYLLGAGVAFGLLCLTKGVLVAVLLGGIALVFLAWDTPRLLRQPYLWLGILLGSVPAACWYGAQWLHYGQTFLGNNLVEQSLQRIWADVEGNGAPSWYYLLELLKGAPWILFLPAGCRLAWTNRNWSWAKLAIVWGSLYFVAISLMATKLPWYILPLFPAIALIVGAQLAEMWQQGKQIGTRQVPADFYSPAWLAALSVLGAVGWLGAVYFIGWAPPSESDLGLILATAGAAFTVAAFLVAQQNPQFINILAWGAYLSLLLLLLSPHWAWELAEAYPVRPVAAMIQTYVPTNQKIYTSYPHNRPSLNFYSQHRVLPASEQELKRVWRRDKSAYLLIDRPTLSVLEISPNRIVNAAEGWLLVTKDRI
jgi:4-amino-4-deoxy-L-arabinose transferase-like glycosyltransferase